MVWWEISPMRDRTVDPPGSEIPESIATPADGFSKPARTLRSVVFPAPLGPNNARHSPSPSENETPATARLVPKFRLRPATSNSCCAVRGPDAVMCLELATLAREAQNGVSFALAFPATQNDRTNERHRRSSPGKQEIRAGSGLRSHRSHILT